MSASAGIVRYRREDGTEATAEIEPNVTWKVPADCVAITGWEWPPAGDGGCFAGGGGPYGYAQGPEAEPGRSWSGIVGVSTREPCEEDDGLRECCGTSRLAYHAEDCRLSRTMRDGMADHERMYRHEGEARDGAQIIAALRKRADMLDKAASNASGPPGTVPATTLAMLAHEFRMLADEAEGAL